MLRLHTISSLVLAVALIGVAWAGNDVESGDRRRLTIAQTKVETADRARNMASGPISDYQQARPVFWRELYAGGCEIARSMFYMAKEFGPNIRARQGKTLKRWNHDDSASATERRRNDLIERIQGN